MEHTKYRSETFIALNLSGPDVAVNFFIQRSIYVSLASAVSIRDSRRTPVLFAGVETERDDIVSMSEESKQSGEGRTWEINGNRDGKHNL